MRVIIYGENFANTFYEFLHTKLDPRQSFDFIVGVISLFICISPPFTLRWNGQSPENRKFVSHWEIISKPRKESTRLRGKAVLSARKTVYLPIRLLVVTVSDSSHDELLCDVIVMRFAGSTKNHFSYRFPTISSNHLIIQSWFAHFRDDSSSKTFDYRGLTSKTSTWFPPVSIYTYLIVIIFMLLLAIAYDVIYKNHHESYFSE